MDHDNWLAMTMQRMEVGYRLRAGACKWKTKTKEWDFEQYVPAFHERNLTEDGGKRLREKSNEILNVNSEAQVTSATTQPLKKRKFMRTTGAAQPSAETTAIITYRTPSPICVKSRSDTSQRSSVARIRLRDEAVKLSPRIPSAPRNSSSLSNSETQPALSASPRMKASRLTSFGSIPQESLLLSSKTSRTAADNHSASGILAFELNPMKICSNWSSIAKSEVLETVGKPPKIGCCPNVALDVESLCKTLLSRALELQRNVSSIVMELKRTEISLEYCTLGLTGRENSIRRAAFRAVIDSYQSHIILQQKATRYSLAIIDFVKNARSSDQQWMILRYSEKLGKLSKVANKSHETELCYSEAETVIDMSLEFEEGLKYRNFLATILSEIGRYGEALNLLLCGFKDYVSTRLSPVGSGPFSRIIFKEGLSQKLKSDTLMQMTKLIQMLHWKTDHDGSLTGAIAKLTCIQELVRNDLDFPHLADEAVVIGAMRLAFEYSQVSLYHRADLVYAFAVPELLRLRDKWYSFRKASELKDYAQHCQWSNKWIASLEALKVTFKYMGLSKGHPPDRLDQALVASLDQIGINFRHHWLSSHTPKSKECSWRTALKDAQFSRRTFATKMNEVVHGSEWWLENLESQLEWRKVPV